MPTLPDGCTPCNDRGLPWTHWFNVSMTDPNRANTANRVAESMHSPAAVRTEPARVYRALRETKPSFITTEFWAMLAGIVALVVLYNTTDNPDLTLWRTCLLSTVIASSYIVSRGWAKSGSHADRVERDY